MGVLISTFWNAVRTTLNQSVSHIRSTIRVPEQNGSIPDPYDPSPRLGYLSKDDYFMAVAFLSAQRSKDPNRQVGSCIVDDKDVILGIGYNGFPRGCPDRSLPWAKRSRSEDPLQTKYPFVVHAEANAILNKNNADLKNTRMFVTLFPCNECAKLLIQAGIKEVIYHEEKQGKDAEMYEASRMMFRMAGIKTRQYIANKKITLEF